MAGFLAAINTAPESTARWYSTGEEPDSLPPRLRALLLQCISASAAQGLGDQHQGANLDLPEGSVIVLPAMLPGQLATYSCICIAVTTIHPVCKFWEKL